MTIVSTHDAEISPNPEADRSRTHEEAIAGSLMTLGDEMLTVCRTEGLTVADFYFPHTTAIYSAATQLVEDGRPVDAASVADVLEQRGVLANNGGLPHLMDLQEKARTANGLRDSARQVVGKARRRRLISESYRLYQMSQDPEISETEIAAEFWELSRGGDYQKRERFPSFDPAQLDGGEFELRYLIDGILVEGQTAMLAGGKKMLKTNIGIDLALSISSGFPFLGKFQVNHTATVGFISGESGAATIQETARRIALAKRQPLRNFTGIRFCFHLPRLGQSDDIRALRSWIEEHGIQVLIVDPMYLAMDGIGDGASNLFIVGKQLLPLAELMQELGVTLIMCHHTRKAVANPYATPELEDIAWAGFQEFARQWLLIGRREAYDPENGGSHKLWLNVGGSAGHSSLWALDIEEGTRQDDGGRRWEVDVLRASQARAQAQEAQDAEKEQKTNRELSKVREKVIAAFRKYPEGETKSHIKEIANTSGKLANIVIVELLESGQLEHCQIERSNKQSYPALRLTRNHSESPGNSDSFQVDNTHSERPPPLGGPSESVCVRNGQSVSVPFDESSESESLNGLKPFNL